MQDLLALLAFPFLATIVFVGMHTWLGLQVLRRKVVYADLALAQLSALGGTVAVAAGHAPGSPAGFGYALLLTVFRAGLLTATRHVSARVSQEAVIGIVYVVATALTVLVVDRSPQGAEHVKRMLVGSILTVGPEDGASLAGLYGAVGLLHWLCRRPLLAAAVEGEVMPGKLPRSAWNLVFYGTFGLVVRSSVALAGVLLVFSFLIIPAVIGTLFRPTRIGAALGIGWVAGALASLVGFGGSVVLDLPTGAAMVVAFALVLAIAASLKPFLIGSSEVRRASLRRAALALSGLLALAVLTQGVWLIAKPAGDQPLLAALEKASGFGPEEFMTLGERRVYAEAVETERRHRDTVENLRAAEREARWKGEGLTEEQLRRVASFQQTFNEMGRGERFVQDHLRMVARERARWAIGVPAVTLAITALLLIVLAMWRVRRLAIH